MRLSSQTTSTGPRSRPRGKSTPRIRLLGQRQHLALADQVVREERQQGQLGELAGLDREAADEDPQLGPVDHRVLRRQQRGDHDQDDADQAERVRVPRQRAVVPDEHQQRAPRRPRRPRVHWIWRNAIPVNTDRSARSSGGTAPRSSRRRNATPSPLMSATVGSRTGSAYGARTRIAMCTPRKIAKRIGHRHPEVGRDLVEQAGLDRRRVDQHDQHREDQQRQLDAAARARTPDHRRRRPVWAWRQRGRSRACPHVVWWSSVVPFIGAWFVSATAVSGRPGGSPADRSAVARGCRGLDGRRSATGSRRSWPRSRSATASRSMVGEGVGVAAVGQNGSTFLLLGSSSVSSCCAGLLLALRGDALLDLVLRDRGQLVDLGAAQQSRRSTGRTRRSRPGCPGRRRSVPSSVTPT